MSKPDLRALLDLFACNDSDATRPVTSDTGVLPGADAMPQPENQNASNPLPEALPVLPPLPSKAGERGAAGRGDSLRADEANAVRSQRSEYDRCMHLDMRYELHRGTRRRFFWRCAKGHAILETAYCGGRILIAPADCMDWQQWQHDGPA